MHACDPNPWPKSLKLAVPHAVETARSGKTQKSHRILLRKPTNRAPLASRCRQISGAFGSTLTSSGPRHAHFARQHHASNRPATGHVFAFCTAAVVRCVRNLRPRRASGARRVPLQVLAAAGPPARSWRQVSDTNASTGGPTATTSSGPAPSKVGKRLARLGQMLATSFPQRPTCSRSRSSGKRDPKRREVVKFRPNAPGRQPTGAQSTGQFQS